MIKMIKKENKIAGTELEVMKLVWRKRASVSSSDIIKELTAAMGWKETTVYTLISRLVEKGFLSQNKLGQVSYYSPTLSERDYTLEQTHDFIDKLFGGDAKQLVSMLYENKSISAGEIKSLRDSWEEDVRE